MLVRQNTEGEYAMQEHEVTFHSISPCIISRRLILYPTMYCLFYC